MEKIQSQFRALYRLAFFVVYLAGFFLVSFKILFFEKDPDRRRKLFTLNTTRWARKGVRLFNISTKVVNRPKEDEVFLYVSNHMGFMDILCAAAILPLSFVTSKEMRETPLLGILTELGGCLYVDRRNKANINNEMKQMGETMKKGFRVVLFPEATSHNGEEILPFKRTLIMSASYAEVPIRPVIFNYLRIDGQPFSLKNRDAVCWYGDMTFAASLWAAMKTKSIDCSVEYLPEYHIRSDQDRASIAEELRARIVEKFIPVIERRQELPVKIEA